VRTLDLVRRADDEVQVDLISRPRPAAELPTIISEFRRDCCRREVSRDLGRRSSGSIVRGLVLSMSSFKTCPRA